MFIIKKFINSITQLYKIKYWLRNVKTQYTYRERLYTLPQYKPCNQTSETDVPCLLFLFSMCTFVHSKQLLYTYLSAKIIFGY